MVAVAWEQRDATVVRTYYPVTASQLNSQTPRLPALSSPVIWWC